MNFLLTLDNKKTFDLTVSLYASNGDPDLYIRSCGNKLDTENCVITSEMMKNKVNLKKEKRDYLFDYSDFMGNDFLPIHHNGTECQNNTLSPFCVYLITVYANKSITNTNRTEFRLIASIDNKHTYLKEQTPIKTTIDIQSSDYYRFTLLNAEDVLSVNFQVTVLGGQPDLFVSRTDQYPGFGRFEKAACFCQNLVRYTNDTPSDAPLNSTYYIAVYGMTLATYTINVFIERNSTENHIIRLFDSIPQKYVMPASDEYAYFQFKVPEIKGPIDIMLSPIKGKIFLERKLFKIFNYFFPLFFFAQAPSNFL